MSSLRGADGMDDTTVRTLLKLALQKKKEEEEVKAKREQGHQDALRAAAYLNSLTSSCSQRRRKKRKKKKLPKTSSHSSRGAGRERQLYCARRRLQQWHACNAGLPCAVSIRAVFPSVVVRPEMLGIMAGMYQKESGALIVDSGSDMCKAHLAGFMPRCVFPLVVGRPVCRSVWTRRTFMQFCWVLLVTMLLALCSHLLLSKRYASRSSEILVFLGDEVISFRIRLFGSTLDTYLCQSTGSHSCTCVSYDGLWKNFFLFYVKVCSV